MRSLLNLVHPVPAIAPQVVADNTPLVSAIIDKRDFDSLMFLINTGTLADADATFAVTMDHGDAANLSDAAAVTAADLDGQGANGSPTAYANAGFTFADDGECRKIAYCGIKRYVRLTITPANNSGNAPISAMALLGHPKIAPTANPPQ